MRHSFTAIDNGEQLDDLLSQPTEGTLETFQRMEGDLLILGVGGKMGGSLARMAKRASEAVGKPRRIIGVSRFGNGDLASRLESWGIETISADLLQPNTLDTLPDAPNVVFMAGMKFGSTAQEPLTWAMNSYLPGRVCERYRSSKIVAFSTGNVYPFTPLAYGGSIESDPPAPVGEYAMSCLGRERIFSYFSETLGFPSVLLRLNYAIALRYGVLTDIGLKVWEGKPIDLRMGAVNVLWQGDANAMALQAFDLAASPTRILNLAGPEQVSIRRVAETFGKLMDNPPSFIGEEAQTALLNNGQEATRCFGYPKVDVQTMIHWTAEWIRNHGELLGKPTKFEVRDGQF